MRIFVIAVAAVLLSACSAGGDISAADAAVGTFHDRLNDEQFGVIYAQSDPAFKSAAPETETLKFLSSVRAKLGRYKSGKRNSWRVNYGTNAGTIILFDSEFEKGKAQETFTFRNGPKALLVGYNVNSAIFVTG